MKTIHVKKSDKQDFFWTLKRITATWLSNGIRLKIESRTAGIGTEN